MLGLIRTLFDTMKAVMKDCLKKWFKKNHFGLLFDVYEGHPISSDYDPIKYNLFL